MVGYSYETDEKGFISGFFSPFIWDKTNGISKLSGDGLSQLIDRGYKNILPTDINNSGQVLAGAFNPEVDESGIGVYWDKDSGFISTGIGVVEDAYVLGINDLGQIVGSGFNDNRFGGYIWQKNTPTINLNFFPSGFNNLGQVVGQSREKTYLWDKNTGLVDLDQVLSTFGWSIEINDREDGRGNLLINNAGQIFGTGFFNGERRAFLLTPDNTKSVPEPATALGVFAFAAFAAASKMKRQRQ
ncbi:hypothetical protein ACE1CI_29910 [Aerosakkonemataceae cyanobacterium BLCC-F50]|uniref:PEP-CTERM sorting domain-containing protein n=1 Tax=Floridaenema flaviceps BLCC-F50 TaxID=3153642 RepID=A0ABV4Y1I8_9CYAN